MVDELIPRPDEKKLAKLLAGHGAKMVAIGVAHGEQIIKALHRRHDKKKMAEYPEFDFDYTADPRLIPVQAVEAMEKRAMVLAGNVGSDITGAVKKIVISHMVEVSRKEAEEQIADMLKANRDRGSLIVTTETTYAYNRGRLASFAEHEVDHIQFSSVMDARTSVQCRTRHGLIMAMDDPRLAANTPPLHGRCRSVLVPVYGSYQPELLTPKSINWDEVAPLPKGWGKAA
jgi:SPP1 gp7 family putative phage head morphogenesis protein